MATADGMVWFGSTINRSIGRRAPDGTVACRATRFEEDLLVATIEGGELRADDRPAWADEPEDVYRALQLGTGDYVRKNGFRSVILGLSGGIDSALVATIASDALGPDRVHVVLMPSRYSSEHSLTDARELVRRVAEALQCEADADAVLEEIARLRQDGGVVEIGRSAAGEAVYATPEMIEVERGREVGVRRVSVLVVFVRRVLGLVVVPVGGGHGSTVSPGAAGTTGAGPPSSPARRNSPRSFTRRTTSDSSVGLTG